MSSQLFNLISQFKERAEILFGIILHAKKKKCFMHVKEQKRRHSKQLQSVLIKKKVRRLLWAADAGRKE